MTSSADLFDCFAVVAPGLEPLALAEGQRLGLNAVAEDGGFGWRGDTNSILRANVGLRIASRVLVRLATFDARSFAELERHARRVPWARIVKAGDTVRFRVTCKKSKLYHSDAVAQRFADALTRTVPGVHAQGGSIGEDDATDDDSALLIVVRFMRDHCTVSADSSGALLHRRGYRQATAKAPLRETLAAALIAASEWDGASPLVDPLCGSGTIPIEAALIAHGVPPGARRTFAMERWPNVGKKQGDLMRAERDNGERNNSAVRIIGSDRDAGAIAAAQSNAARAGVSAELELAVRSISAAQFPGAERGWVVTNPPYGVRVSDSDQVRDLWAQLGKVLREGAAGWRVAVLSPEARLERQLGVTLKVVATTRNGGIPVRLLVGDVPK